MDKNSEIIRTEILRILNENGKTRAAELVRKVRKKAGNDKMIYREISALVEAGEIEKRTYTKSHIEYELINVSESVNRQLKHLHKEVEIIFEDIKDFEITTKERSSSFQERLRAVIYLAHMVQSVEGMMKLVSFYPAFKKDKMFSQIKRKIVDCWQAIMNIIVHQPERDFLNKVLANLRIADVDSKSVN